MKRLPQELRLEAERMRAVEGLAIHQIARELGISYATARRWTLDIELSADQQRALEQSRIDQAAQASSVMAEAFRAKRLAWQEEGRRRARMGNSVHQAGCFLYWAEGSKSRNVLTLANSDVNLMRVFLAFLREELRVTSDRLTFRLHLYTGNGLTVREVEDHWLEQLELPRSALRRHSLNNAPAATSGVKRNKLPYGVGTLVVRKSTPLVQHIYGAIQEYGGFEEPRWVDL
jgi:transposase-like protein